MSLFRFRVPGSRALQALKASSGDRTLDVDRGNRRNSIWNVTASGSPAVARSPDLEWLKNEFTDDFGYRDSDELKGS